VRRDGSRNGNPLKEIPAIYTAEIKLWSLIYRFPDDITNTCSHHEEYAEGFNYGN
jgi:hypothetical protein